ncbi:hypothetical protein DPMN_011991 [Dreissena polymorpha]|uniref:Uncharacterized protein n=1 Tax=Dreissena polymorpha TaxID=45954 RepID=A0A9D4S0J1_DREPO|nr:hypothetical protein DPMN_011991 [Dreissena polymorpha]
MCHFSQFEDCITSREEQGGLGLSSSYREGDKSNDSRCNEHAGQLASKLCLRRFIYTNQPSDLETN